MELGDRFVASYFDFLVTMPIDRFDERVTMAFVTDAGVLARSFWAAGVPSDDRLTMSFMSFGRMFLVIRRSLGLICGNGTSWCEPGRPWSRDLRRTTSRRSQRSRSLGRGVRT